MSPRYFVDSPVSGTRIDLHGQEAHHLQHVMRARVGETAVLFDGSGYEFVAHIRSLCRSHIELEIMERRAVDRELPGELVLGVAFPKGERQRWLVEKAVELGVSQLVPLCVAHSVARPAATAVDRWRRQVVEASKQCGRNRLMQIAPSCDWAEFVARPGGSAQRWIAHADRSAPWENAPLAGPLVIAVGPEGGWTEDELGQALEHGWRRLSLGSRTLRTETAAVAAAALGAWSLNSAAGCAGS